MDVDLEVDVKGIVLDDDPDTADVTEELGGTGTYGVVTYRGNFSPTQEIGEVTRGLSCWQRLCYHHLGGSKLYQGGSDVHDRHQKRDRPRRGWCC